MRHGRSSRLLGHQLEVILMPGPVYLDADPVRLAQVLSNLLNNAAKYMDRGGKIWLTTARDGCRSCGSDGASTEGIGIPAEALPLSASRCSPSWTAR